MKQFKVSKDGRLIEESNLPERKDGLMRCPTIIDNIMNELNLRESWNH